MNLALDTSCVVLDRARPRRSWIRLAITLLWTACRAPVASTPEPVAPLAGIGGPLDIACASLPSGRFAAPTPWTTVSPEFEAYVDALAASPYRNDSPEHRVDDLSVYEDTLYVGLGDTHLNPGSRYCAARGGACAYEDAPGHGIPVYHFERGSDTAQWEHVVREELVNFQRLGDALLVPARDPTEGDGELDCEEEGADPACPEESEHPRERFELGELHARVGGSWVEYPAFETALHVYGLTVADGRWYASGSSEPGDAALNGFATIWGSDDGVSWEVEYLDADREGTRRVTALVQLGTRLLALGYHVEGDVGARLERVDGAWIPVDGLAPGLRGAVQLEVLDSAHALAWDASHAALISETDGGLVSVTPAWLPESERVVDAWLLCRGDLLVLTTRGVWSGEHAVYRTRDGVLAEELVRFTPTSRFGSLALWGSALVFGDADGWLWTAEAAGDADP